MNPTVALIPSAYKSGFVYSVLPASDSGDFNFNRPSSATRVNKDGLVDIVLSKVPRLDYTNGNCPQLLLEPQSSNLVTYSQDLSNSDWFKFSSGTTPLVEDSFISPSGEANANKITFYSGADGIVTNNATVSTSSNYSLSIYMKGVKGGERIRLDFKNNASQGNIGTTFTLTNQWVRYTVENLTPLQTSQGLQIRCTNPSEDVQLYAWGGQIEELRYSTSYIPTEATSVTRSRDLMTDSMLGKPEITSDDWTLFLDFNKSDLGDNRCVSINDGSSNNRILISQRDENQLNFYLYQSGSTLSSYIYDMTGIDDLKVCFGSTNTGASIVVNGVEIDRLDDGRFDASSLASIDFTEYGTTNEFAGRVNDFRYYNVALSLNERIALTK